MIIGGKTMEKKYLILKLLRAVFVIFYAIFLLWLIPKFFFNYDGEWMKRVAERLPIRERNMEIGGLD
jgi:hypothetical protein